MKKSQYSMEFLIFFSLISLIFLVWMSIYGPLSEDSFKNRDTKAINDLGMAIQSHIFLASKVHTGYKSTELYIPSKAGPVNFTINNSNYVFYLRANNQDFIFSVPYIIGKLVKGNNTLWNVEGVVAVSPVPPIIRPDGNINFTQCSDTLDNDGVGDIDSQDPQCIGLSGYNWTDDDESS